MKKADGRPDHIRENLFSDITAFAPAVCDVFEQFELHAQVERLAKSGLLYQVSEKFAGIDRPSR